MSTPSLRVNGVKFPDGMNAPEVINVKDPAYGAKIDGATDDTAAINAAIAAATSGGTVFIPDGNVKLSSTITLNKAGVTLVLGTGTYTSTANPAISISASNVSVRGAGYFATQLFVNSATNDGIVAGSSLSGIDIENMCITCHSNSNTRTSGYGVHLISVGDWRLENLYIRDPWIGINIDGSNTGFAEKIIIDTTLAAQSMQYGVLINDGSIQNHFHKVLVTSSATAFDTGFYIDGGTDSAVFNDCLVQGSGTGGASFGFKFAFNSGSFKARWIKMTDCYVEVAKTTGIGFQLDQVTDVEMKDCYSAWGLNNIHVTANAKNVTVRGGTCQLAYQYGILVDAGTYLTFDGVTVTDSSQQTNITYDGIALAGGSHIKVVNCNSGNIIWNGSSPASASNFMRYGIFTVNAVDYYFLVNNDTKATSGTGGINDTATGIHKTVTGNLS